MHYECFECDMHCSPTFICDGCKKGMAEKNKELFKLKKLLMKCNEKDIQNIKDKIIDLIKEYPFLKKSSVDVKSEMFLRSYN